MYKKKFQADLNVLREMLSFVQDYCKQLGFNSSVCNKIVLAVEEAIVNVIHHGYPNNPGEIEISCDFSQEKPGIKILIKDQGVPFNPVKQAFKIKKHLPHFSETYTEKEKVGGYGIYIFVGIMDRIEYQRIEGGNLLALIKYL